MAEQYAERHFEDPEWEERWQMFKQAMEEVALQERQGELKTSHFSGIELNFDLMSQEEKRRSMEIWEKINDGSITRQELDDYRKFMGEIIGNITESADMNHKEMFRLTRYGISSYLVNAGTPVVARKDLAKRENQAK